jgi:hypothetical protein
VEPRPLLPRLVLGGLGGGLVAGLINVAIAVSLGPIRVGNPAHAMTVGPWMVLPESIAPGFAAAFLLVACDPLEDHGRAFFVILSLAVLLVSFAIPISTGLDGHSVGLLIAMHVITAVLVLVGLWVAMPRRAHDDAHHGHLV